MLVNYSQIQKFWEFLKQQIKTYVEKLHLLDFVSDPEQLNSCLKSAGPRLGGVMQEAAEIKVIDY